HIPLYTGHEKRQGLPTTGISFVVTNREAVYRLLEPFRALVLSGHLHESDFTFEGRTTSGTTARCAAPGGAATSAGTGRLTDTGCTKSVGRRSAGATNPPARTSLTSSESTPTGPIPRRPTRSWR